MNIKFTTVKSRLEFELKNIDKLFDELKAHHLLEATPTRADKLKD